MSNSAPDLTGPPLSALYMTDDTREQFAANAWTEDELKLLYGTAPPPPPVTPNQRAINILKNGAAKAIIAARPSPQSTRPKKGKKRKK